MPRYKVLKGVAHNIGHSFTSTMNYASGDYVMGHILRLARASGKSTLKIDFVTGDAAPPELLVEPVSRACSNYASFFWSLVQSSGSDRSCVQSASLFLNYDLTVQRPMDRGPLFLESPYVCEVRIVDMRGKKYTARLAGWWYPERLPDKPSTGPVRTIANWLKCRLAGKNPHFAAAIIAALTPKK
jgi:hypothetical protein